MRRDARGQLRPQAAIAGHIEVAASRQRHGGALVGRARFERIALARISGGPCGLPEMGATPDGRQVVGVRVVGDGDTELVAVGPLGLMIALDIVRQRRRTGGPVACAAARTRIAVG